MIGGLSLDIQHGEDRDGSSFAPRTGVHVHCTVLRTDRTWLHASDEGLASIAPGTWIPNELTELHILTKLV